MKNTKTELLDAVKCAVARYGLSGISTRIIGATAGVNDGLIYHYFDDKEDLLQQAYTNESNNLFAALLGFIDEVHGIPFSMKDKVRLVFHRTWHEMLSDPDRLLFLNQYYYSAYFTLGNECHELQIVKLLDCQRKYFSSDTVCMQTMYALMTLLYDSTRWVILGRCENTDETEEMIFSLFFGMLCSQLNAEAISLLGQMSADDAIKKNENIGG